MAILLSQLVIRTSRTVGSAKKFVRIISGFGGGEFTKTKCKSVTIFIMFFVGRLILRELHFIYSNKLYIFLIVKAFAIA
jgi:TRAP-type C4-dicarboxylate transport system permease large subunit